MPCSPIKNTQRTFEVVQAENAFPPINLPFKPLRGLITVQFRTQRSRSATGGLIIPDQAKLDMFHDQVVRVIAISDTAFTLRNPETGRLVSYPEGPHFKIGDYVRIPKHGADVMFYQLSPSELEYVKKISDEARCLKKGTYIADEGLYEKQTIKTGNCFFHEVNGVVTDPLLILNAH